MLRTSAIFGFSILGLFLPSMVLGDTHTGQHGKRHIELARRAPGDVARRAPAHTNAKFSWYDVGLGACGETNVETEYIVALNADEYGGGSPGPNCFKYITIAYGGKQTTARVMDRCPGCPHGGLDLSKGLFQYLASLGDGIIYGQWWFNDDAPTPSTTAQPTPTSTYVPPPPTTSSSTWVAPTTSSTYVAPTTSSTVPPTTSSTPSPSPSPSSSTQQTGSSEVQSSSAYPESSVVADSGSASVAPSGSASAVESVPTSGVKNDGTAIVLESLNQAIMGMSGLVITGAQSS